MRMPKRDEKGFSLVELIVAIAIVAIVSAIAIPIVLTQRTAGVTAAEKADLLNVSAQLENSLQGWRGNPPAQVTVTTVTTATPPTWSATPSGGSVAAKGNLSTGTDIEGTMWTDGSYALYANNASGNVLLYRSDTEQITTTTLSSAQAVTNGSALGGTGTLPGSTDAGLPGAPTINSAVASTSVSNSVTVTWSAPTSGGTPTGYTVKVTGASSVLVGSGVTTTTVNNVPTGAATAYVYATNANGTGPGATASVSVTGTPAWLTVDTLAHLNAVTGAAGQHATVTSDSTTSNDGDYLWSTVTSAWVSTKNGTPANNNIIINGDFRINQRNYASGATLASGAYGFDRWKSDAAGTTLTYTANVSGPIVTINSGTHGIEQIVEQANVPAGNYTLSWSGTATCRVYNVGGSAPSYASSPIVTAVTGTANLTVECASSAGASATLGLVKLEMGSTATAWYTQTYDQELLDCERYYYQTTANTASQRLTNGFFIAATLSEDFISLPTPMRATPTVTFSSLVATNGVTANWAVSALSLYQGGLANNGTLVDLEATSATGATAGQGATLAASAVGGYIALSAEL